MQKNRLYMNRVYLAGAMDRVADGGVGWRDDMTPWLNSRGIIVLNPVNKPCSIGKENAETRKIRHDAKMKGDYGPLLKDRDVRGVDLRLVDNTDFTIVNLDLDTHPCGTYEELFWANREKKPIIVRCVQGKNYAPDWLWWTIPHQMIFGTWDEVKAYIDHVAFAPEESVDRFKRWVFFDWDSVTKPAIRGWEILSKGGTDEAIQDVKNWLPSQEDADALFAADLNVSSRV